MAFIVEIFRSPQIKTTGVDLRMADKTWKALLSLAQEAGWQPAGTIKPPTWKGDYFIFEGKDQFVNDYKPDYPESKMVTADDALAMAAALEKLKEKMSRDGQDTIYVNGPTIIKEGATVAVYKTGIDLAFLDEFIAYIKQDAFEFWWDD